MAVNFMYNIRKTNITSVNFVNLPNIFSNVGMNN